MRLSQLLHSKLWPTQVGPDAASVEIQDALRKAYEMGRASLTDRDMVDRLLQLPVPEDEDMRVPAALGGWRRDYEIPVPDVIVIYRTRRDSTGYLLGPVTIAFRFNDDGVLQHILAEPCDE